MYLVSKGRGGRIRLYRVRHADWDSAGPVTARLLQTLPIIPRPAAGRLVTGAAIRADGRLVAIRTYMEIYFFVPRPDGRLAASQRPVCSIAGKERLGEAIDFLNDSTLVLTSEADPVRAGTIHTVRCPRCRPIWRA